jgi:hypothetical protein
MEFMSKLRAAIPTFDEAQLTWAAEGFAWSSTLSALVDKVEAANATHLDEALIAVASNGPFDCFALACLARHGGVGKDVVHEGALSELPVAVAGNLVVKGPLICNTENWLVVAGDVDAEALITSADVIVGGRAKIRDGVIGLNSFTQSMWVRGDLECPVLIAEDYATEVGDKEAVELGDDSVNEVLAPGLADQVREWLSDEGPDGAVRELLQRVEGEEPIFAGSSE